MLEWVLLVTSLDFCGRDLILAVMLKNNLTGVFNHSRKESSQRLATADEEHMYLGHDNMFLLSSDHTEVCGHRDSSAVL